MNTTNEKKTKQVSLRITESMATKLDQYGKLIKKPKTHVFKGTLDRFDDWWDKYSDIRLALGKYLTEDVIVNHIKLGDDLVDVLIQEVLYNVR